MPINFNSGFVVKFKYFSWEISCFNSPPPKQFCVSDLFLADGHVVLEDRPGDDLAAGGSGKRPLVPVVGHEVVRQQRLQREVIQVRLFALVADVVQLVDDRDQRGVVLVVQLKEGLKKKRLVKDLSFEGGCYKF